jgi:hypothetical protein
MGPLVAVKPAGPYMGLVTWLDAHGDAAQQVWDLSSLDHRPLVMETLGWVVREDATGVTLFTERVSNSDGTFSWRGRGFIPAGMLVSVHRVEIPKRRLPKGGATTPVPAPV